MKPGETVQRRRRNQRFLNFLSWLILLLMALPAFWIVLTAFRPNSEINSWPPVWVPQELTLDAFATMFGLNPEERMRVPVESYMRNSLLAAGISTVVAVSIGTLAGYASPVFVFAFRRPPFLALCFRAPSLAWPSACRSSSFSTRCDW